MLKLIFPTPVFETSCRGITFDQIQKEFDRVYEDQSTKDLFSDPWDDGRIKVSNKGDFGANIIEQYDLKVFKAFLHDNIVQYMKSCGNRFDDYDIQCWMTNSTNGSYAHIHNHHGCDVAGAYYYKTNGDDGAIFFECPDAAFNSQVGRGTIFPPSIVSDPVVGKLLLFPSWLKHGVSTNKTNNERLSVSFNITFKYF